MNTICKMMYNKVLWPFPISAIVFARSLFVITESFVEFVEGDMKLCEVMMDLAGDFIEQHIPITDEDSKYDLALMMMERVMLKAWINKKR